MSLDENERGRSHNQTTRRQWRPPEIAATDAPCDPGRCPLDTRNPDPTIVRIIDPPTIVIAGPPPRLVACPVPAAIGPDPLPIAIGPPRHRNMGWMPAASIGTDLHPDAMWREWFVKFRRGTDLHRRGNFQVRRGVEQSRIRTSQQANYQIAERFFHNVSFRFSVCWWTMTMPGEPTATH